jgi:hypothetical protein
MVSLETIPHFQCAGIGRSTKNYETIEAISKDLGAHVMFSKM